MTEQTMGVEYSETFIGECASGGCAKPATVRVSGSFVLCALHFLKYELAEDANQASLTVELVKPWRDEAKVHGLDALAESLEGIADEQQGRYLDATDRMKQLDQVNRESDQDEMRRRMGEKRRELEEARSTIKERPNEEGGPSPDRGKVCAVPDCDRPQGDRSRGCLAHDVEYDAASELEAWEWVQSLLEPWTKATEPIGSPELTRVMGKALSEVKVTVERARKEWEKARAELRLEGS